MFWDEYVHTRGTTHLSVTARSPSTEPQPNTRAGVMGGGPISSYCPQGFAEKLWKDFRLPSRYPAPTVPGSLRTQRGLLVSVSACTSFSHDVKGLVKVSGAAR